MSGQEKLIAELREKGKREFAVWNEEAFSAYLEGPIQRFAQSLKWRDKDVTDGNSVTNLIRLVYHGVGAGWLRPKSDDLPPATFLAHCLWTLVPYQLSGVPIDQRAAALRMIWNIGEGLAKEPQWLNQFAITRTSWSINLLELDKHLSSALAPAVSTSKPSDWLGELDLQVMDLRESDDGFMPGRMYLASPAVMCIEDRTTPTETIGIFLQKNGESEILGSVGTLPEYSQSTELPVVSVASDSIAIGDRTVAAPLISSPRQSLTIATGFVAVCAEDSQRLWLVEAR